MASVAATQQTSSLRRPSLLPLKLRPSSGKLSIASLISDLQIFLFSPPPLFITHSHFDNGLYKLVYIYVNFVINNISLLNILVVFRMGNLN